MNAVEIEQAVSELAQQPFDPAQFPFQLLAAFGHKETALRRLRSGNANLSDVTDAAVASAVLLRNNLHIAVAQPGEVSAALNALRNSPANTKGKPKFLIATDGHTLEAEDLASGETAACDFPELPNHFGFLLPLAGISTIKEIKDNPIDVRATILRFHQTHGRVPQHGEGRDIFERLYAVRLDQLRKLPDARALLGPLDSFGLLGKVVSVSDVQALDEDALLAELGMDAVPAEDDIRVLRHVRSHGEKKAAEDIAERTPCEDFERFAPLFEQVERELASGARQTRKFGRDAKIVEGSFFVVSGMLALVAEVGEPIRAPNGESDARLRVIYANGTQSNLLRRSLQRALYKDTQGRSVTGASEGALFGDTAEPDDIASGTIYVLRSRSEHPFVAEHREVIHKIGVTGGDVKARIAGAERDATYLLAGVDVIVKYQLHNLNRTRLENLFHRLFAAAQLDITLHDRFGQSVKPREWFLVPLPVIDEAVARICDGSIGEYVYDPATASLRKA